MHNLLAVKLQRFTALSPCEVAAIEHLSRHPARTARPRRDIIREGDRPVHVKLMIDGWAFRYKMLADGRRQIVSFMLPGDLCDAGIFLLDEMDHSICALTPVTYAELQRDELVQLCSERPAVARALSIEAQVVTAIQREWTVSLGQRTARERIAHLFCELFERLEAIDLAEGDRCEMPLTQIDLAEATGMTAVHVNRTLQDLRREGLIALQNRILTIPDRRSLKRVAMFNPNYLHHRYSKWEPTPTAAIG